MVYELGMIKTDVRIGTTKKIMLLCQKKFLNLLHPIAGTFPAAPFPGNFSAGVLSLISQIQD
jgi:hypothetical protein